MEKSLRKINRPLSGNSLPLVLLVCSNAAFTIIVGLSSCAPAMAEDNSTKVLSRAEHLAWRGNWPRAGPLFEQAEKEFSQAGDTRNQLQARLGRIRSQMQNATCQVLSGLLASE